MLPSPERVWSGMLVALIWLLLGLLVGLPAPRAQAQFMGVLSTPITVATIGRTNAGSEGQVAAQGAGVKIRLLGFFMHVDRLTEVQWRDSNGTACTGRLTVATGEAVNVPVAPPGYVCETAANTRLDLNVTNTALSVGSPVVGGVVIWQASQ